MPIATLALGLAQFAPQILRFFGVGEKSEQVAQKVADIAGAITGTTKPEEILEKLKADSELAQKFQLAVLAANEDLEKAYLGDRADARHRDIEIRKTTGGRNERADLMVFGAVVGLITCIVVLAFYRAEIPEGAASLLTTIASIFGLCLRDAFQFEFGSSRSEQKKDETIAKWADEA